MDIRQIAYNRSSGRKPIKYIVIHCTGNYSNGAGAEAHYNYWNSGNVGQSADFVVDDSNVIQLNDYIKYYTWHCGDGQGKYGISNSNSIGIEICVNPNSNFELAVENAKSLVKYLMTALNINIEHVVRHYEASKKMCLFEFSANNWVKWWEFKKQLEVVKIKELDSINDIVWELAEKGIISDKDLWLKKLEEDSNSYWLARKCVNYMQNK